ncbi:MAG TPA: LysM peptidoglycan-binding domain-containing protein [Spirochaetota bacterium]|nr:LysM peptidoglycan-binding domain-containing protein [Spirochaetota bacterium]
MKHIMYYIIVLSIAFAMGCASDLPIRDMSKARYGITEAEEVKAPQYAPDELEKAKQYLYDTHILLKDDKTKDAQKKSVESYEQSQKAIEKSLPLYSSDMVTQAKNSINEIEMLNAREFAPTEYAQAVALATESSDLHNKTNYRQSIQKSREAITSANDAKVKSIAMIPQLKEQLVALEKERDELSNNRGDEFAKQQLQDASAKIGEANTKLDEQNITASIAAMQQAKESLLAAKVAIDKGNALESLEAAKSLYKEVSLRETAQDFSEQLTQAEGLIKTSEDKLKAEQYPESYDTSQQATNILNTMLIAMEKKEEAIAIQEEGEETKQEATTTTKEVTQPQKDYIVQYNPKARDCLWRIAMKVYNNARLWPLIYIANKDQIKDPDLIFPGQRFVIPSMEKEKQLIEESQSKTMDDKKPQDVKE